VQIIAALPATISALKIAAPTAMLGAIIGEYLGGVDSGLGIAIPAAQPGYVVPRTWGLALVCGLVAGLGYVVIGLIGRVATPWAKNSAANPGGRAARGGAAASRLLAFGRDVWALAWPMVLAIAIVVVGWIVFLKAFSVPAVEGKTPDDVWRYLFTAPKAAANRSLISGLMGTTLHDASLGYVAGMVAAIIVGLLFVVSTPIEQAFMPIAMLLRSVPLVAMTPIILLIFKSGTAGIAVIGGIVVFFPALVNIVFGLRSASSQTSDLVMAYGGNQLTVVRKVALPTALPAIFAAARISVPGALIGALVAEWLATGQGIGGAILNAIGAFDYNEVWTSIAVLTGTSLLIYTAVGVIESIVLTSFGFNDPR
jgi:ABC-type nitrate/sulfonate/bicarbonate transport system permease component